MSAVVRDRLGSPLLAATRLSVYLAFTLSLMPLQAAALALTSRGRQLLPRWYHARCCRILGIEVQRRGRQSRNHPTLYVSNHVSYLDITVLGSVIAGSFIAKAEVARWPLFGWLAMLQRTVFVERQVSRTAVQRDQITGRLAEGDSLVLFAEGTSDDGNRVLPFRSSLFAVAECRHQGEPVVVQPVSIAYTKLDGLPLGRFLRPFFAWYGDMDLAPHLWQLVGLGRVTVVVEFHPPVSLAEFASRKALCAHCHEAVSGGVAAALTGRPRTRSAQPIAEAA